MDPPAASARFEPPGEASASDPLASPYRRLRGVDSPQMPFAMTLARCAGTNVLLLPADGTVAVEAVLSDLGPHVWAAIDVLRSPDGHEYVLPDLREPVEDFVTRRRARGVLLTAGEAITLGVSIVRGFGALLRAEKERLAISFEPAPERCGRWWITADGTPVIVLGDRTTTARSTSHAALLAIADSCPASVAQVLVRAANGIGDPDPIVLSASCLDALDRTEDDLFAHGDPEPLAVEGLGPPPESDRPTSDTVTASLRRESLPSDRARDEGSAPDVRRALRDRRISRRGATQAAGVRFALSVVRGLVDERLVGAAISAMSRTRVVVASARRRRGDSRRDVRTDERIGPRSETRQRRRGLSRLPIAVAASAAVVVLLVGLLWPSDPAEQPDGSLASSRHAAEDPASPTPAATRSPSPAASPVADEGAAEPTSADEDDLVRVARALLESAASCERAEPPACAAVHEPGRAVGELPVETGAGASLVLLDDLGGVAVLRLDRPSAPSAIVTIVTAEGEWRLRDVRELDDEG